jgi:hypothetical protein
MCIVQLWDIRRAISIVESERCLQTFTTMDFQLSRVPYAPRQVVSMPVEPDGIVVVGPRLKSFQLKRMVADTSAPSAVVYNAEFFSFFIAADRNVRVSVVSRRVACSAVQCSAVQCSAVQCSAVQCSACRVDT